MNYRWKFNERCDEKTIHDLSKELKISQTLAKVLCNRGISTKEEAENFFQPNLDDLHDPELMLNMDKAVERILIAKENNEGVWVHGDYDVDGTTSTSLIVLFLRELGIQVEYFIPDRFIDGFGLSIKSVDLALQHRCKLFISVDVGITAIKPLEHAKKIGIDTIICDHHQPGEEFPEVHALLDPIQHGCDYPFKELAACGVVFKLIQGVFKKLGTPKKAYKYLDFVALASAADMVPLLDENRILVHYGLKKLNENPRPGFKGLIHCTKLDPGSITALNSVYALAPIINAAGRMGAAMRSVEMMTNDDEIAAFQIAQQLEDENRKRRVFDAQTFEEAIPMAEEEIKKGRKVLVLHKPDWHVGVIGIVASRLVDKFNLPTFLLTSIDGMGKGSARSANGFDVHSALKASSNLLDEYGGHTHAAGMTIKEEYIPQLKENIDNIARNIISNEMLVPELSIDAELKLNELSPKFLKTLARFAPHGYANPKPMFISRGVTSANGVKIIGQNNLKFRAFQLNFVIDAIGYGLADKIKIITSGKPFDLIYNLEINSHYLNNYPQLYIKDIKQSEN